MCIGMINIKFSSGVIISVYISWGMGLKNVQRASAVSAMTEFFKNDF